MNRLELYNDNCIRGAQNKLKNEIFDLLICDPPFCISESKFGQHYNRDESIVLDGYIEAPPDYQKFSNEWIGEAERVLKKNGTLYIISSWKFQ